MIPRYITASIATVLAVFLFTAAMAGGPQFVENKGQWPDEVRYRLRAGNAHLYFRADGIRFHMFRPDIMEGHAHADADQHASGPDGYAYDMQFVGARTDAKVVGEGRLPYYHNYILGNDPRHWASEVGVFSGLKYEGIYDGVDVIYREVGGRLKYDLHIAVGADPASVRMRYEGTTGVELGPDGTLIHRNPFNHITETAPVAFQLVDGKKVGVACRFVLNGGTVRFDFPEGYDNTLPLVIDPTLIFSSYTGSTADNFGFTATYDQNGSLYGGGIVFAAGYPFVTGSFSGTWSGVIDMGISKFTPDGSNLIYSTYIGGAGSETPNSMIVNSAGQLVILGTSGSDDFPTSATAYDQTFNGGVSQNFPTNGTSFPTGTDIVVAVLSADGSSLVGATYLGGAQNDGLNTLNGSLQYNYGDQFRGEVIVNAQNDIFIMSSTQSSGFPASAGAFDQTLGGTQDAVVARFNPDVSVLSWASFLGGGSADAGYSIKLSPNGDLYATGGTQSTNLPLGPGGLTTTAPGGLADGFLMRIGANGSAILAGTYLGTSAYDQSYFVEIDADGDVYTYGQTLGAYPVSAGVYSNPNSRQFIHKLNAGLSATLFSTVFGSGSASVNISPSAFLVDQCKRIYTSGWGGSVNNAQNSATGNTAGMSVTANAQQSGTDNSDFYFMVLETDATSLIYATYFGGTSVAEHVDGGTSRFNPQGQIYQAVCAGCGSSDNFPTTPGAWSQTNNSNNCNLGVIKFDFEITNVDVSIDIQGSSTSGCAPFTVDFSSITVNADALLWDFGDGSPTSTQQGPVHVFQNPGTYVVTLTGTNSTNCPGQIISDQATITITVSAGFAVNAGPDTETCAGSGVPIGVAPQAGLTYSWSPATGLSDQNVSNPVASPTADITYTLTVSDGTGCTGTDQVSVTVNPLPVADAGADVEGCQGASFQLLATGGTDFSWSPQAGLNNPDIANPVVTVASPVTYTVTVTDANGCEDTDEMLIDIFSVDATASAPSVCAGGSVTLTASTGTSWLWAPPIDLSSTSAQNPTSTPAQTITYSVFASNGTCQALDDVTVTVNPLPVASAGADQTACSGDAVTLTATGGSTYSWSPTTGLSAPNAASTQASAAVGTITYTVTATDGNGCQGTDDVTVLINPLPAVTTGPDSTLCLGGSMVLGANGALTYTWSPAIGLSDPNIATPVASPDSPVTYSVTGTDQNGCTGTDAISLDFFTVAAGTDTAICAEQAVQVFVSGSGTFQWSPTDGVSDPTSPSPFITPNGNSIYMVEVTSPFGCLARDSVQLTVLTLPVAAFTAQFQPTCDGVQAFFSNQSADSGYYQWLFGDGTGSTTAEPQHIYPIGSGPVVTLIAFDGDSLCSDTVTVDFSGQWIGSDTIEVVFGNVITPNNDAHNDCFMPGFVGDMSNCYQLIVYNRWGGLIFESEVGSGHCWDGRTKAGRMVEDGTYYYIVRVADIEKAGWVLVASH